MENAKKENRNFRTSHWDLENTSINPLKKFFKKILQPKKKD